MLGCCKEQELAVSSEYGCRNGAGMAAQRGGGGKPSSSVEPAFPSITGTGPVNQNCLRCC